GHSTYSDAVFPQPFGPLFFDLIHGYHPRCRLFFFAVETSAAVFSRSPVAIFIGPLHTHFPLHFLNLHHNPLTSSSRRALYSGVSSGTSGGSSGGGSARRFSTHLLCSGSRYNAMA